MTLGESSAKSGETMPPQTHAIVHSAIRNRFDITQFLFSESLAGLVSAAADRVKSAPAAIGGLLPYLNSVIIRDLAEDVLPLFGIGPEILLDERDGILVHPVKHVVK